MNLEEITVESKTLYDGRIITLKVDTVTLPDGNTALREVVEHPGGVCAVALDEEKNIYLVEQFRYPYAESILEIPAGKRNTKDEDPLACGKRELQEETGIVAAKWVSLGELYPSPGYCGEIIYLYAATELSHGSQHLDADEFLNVRKLPLDRAVEKILSGEIKDAKTQAAVLKVKLLHEQGKI